MGGKVKGDGSIIKRAEGVWEVQLSLGKDPMTGKYRKVARTVHGTKAQASRVLRELQQQKDAGIRLEASKTTVSELIDLWLDAKRTAGTCSKTKIRSYATLLGYVRAHIGNAPVVKIDARTIEQVYSKVREETGLGGTSMLTLHQILKSVFEKAVDYEIINRNPCAKVTAPKADAVSRRSLDESEVARLSKRLDEAYSKELSKADGKEARQFERGNGFGRSYVVGIFELSCISLVKLALATGMRRGELIALAWEDVNLGRGTVTVRHAASNDGEVKEPKSKAGLRTIAIDPETTRHLESWAATQASYLLRLGMTRNGKTFVFCGNTGGMLNGSNLERWWRGFREEIGFDGLHLHELRHTQATQLLANGGDLKMVQARLGHANASLTLGTYAHAIPQNDAKAAEIMGALMGNEKAAETPIIRVKTA